MRYAKGVVITFLAKGLAVPVGIASSIITARYLGPSGRGVLAILMALQAMAIQFGSVGFNASVTYFISRDRNSTQSVASNAFVVAVALGLFLSILFLCASFIAPRILLGNAETKYLHIFLIAIPFGFLPQFLQNVLIAHQKLYEFNALDLFSRLLQLVGFIIVLVFLRLGTVETIVCVVFVTVISGVVYLWQTLKITPLSFTFDKRLFAKMFRYGVKTYIAGLLLFFVTRSNIFLINYYLGESQSGVYSVAMQFMDVVYILPATMGLILFPKVSENANDPGQLTAKVFRFSVFLMALVCGSIALLGRPIIQVMFGEKFLGAVEPLVWLAPGMFAMSLANIILNDLAGRGLPNIVMIAPAVGFVANLAITLSLLSTLGITAAAVGSTVAYILMLIILFLYFTRRLNIDLKQMLLFHPAELKTIKLGDS